ncbi:MAG: hypothetical protein H7Y09_06840 [Chitinophagaceae bacterium]|nr:hypothetical protein [Anaerolineae bacterium]
MPVNVAWIEESSIIEFQCQQEITADDINFIGEKGTEAAEHGAIYSLIDFTMVTRLPRNLVNTTLRSTTFLAFANHPNARWLVFVKPNAAVRFMIEIALRNVSIKIVEERDIGVQFLRERAQTGDLPQDKD